jgi:glutaredoxin 3
MKIEIYGKKDCSFCVSAKALLDHKGLSYEYQDFFELNSNAQSHIQTERAPSAKTFPIIFIDDTYIGGFTNLERAFN